LKPDYYAIDYISSRIIWTAGTARAFFADFRIFAAFKLTVFPGAKYFLARGLE
jgi:hypothetical protein